MKNHDQQHAAYLAVARARKRGELPHKAPCVICGDRGIAHHEDYSTPLDVTWLCVLHHAWRHQGDSYEEMRATLGEGLRNPRRWPSIQEASKMLLERIAAAQFRVAA